MATSGDDPAAGRRRGDGRPAPTHRVVPAGAPTRRSVLTGTLALLAAVPAGCTAEHGRPAGGPTGRSPGSPAAGAAPAADFCRVPLPAGWRRRLTAGRLDPRAGESLTVHAVGDDGHTVVVDSRTRRRHSVLFLHDGRRREVLRLRHPDTDQLFGAAYDGRHLVFSVSHDPANLSAWTLYAWDSAGHTPPRVLARNATDRHGDPVDSPMLYPVVAHGHAAWTAGTADGGDQVHRYDLATGTDHVVRTGHPGVPLLVGDDLVWPESPAPGRLTELHAVTLAAGRPVELPAPLAGIRGPAFIAGGPAGTVAWVGADVHSLWVWRTGWPDPVRALHVPEGRNLQWVRVAGDVVTVDDGTAQWAADLRTGSYTRLTTHYGYTVAAGHALAVGYPPTGKTGVPDPPAVVDTGTLPSLPGCA